MTAPASGLHTTAGSTLSLSAAQPATYDKTGYAALTWAEVGEISDLGSFGSKYNVVKYNTVKNRATSKRKGSYDAGTMTLKIGYDSGDAGQSLALGAVASDLNYSVQVVLQNGQKFAFQAQVTSFEYDLGNVDKITEATVILELTADPSGNVIIDIT